jgi:predicted protein tyrosine phosphatase
MKIQTFNEDEIQNFKTEEKHIVISIQDPAFGFVKLPEQESRLGWIGFKFYDLDKEIPGFSCNGDLFEREHAIGILLFVETWKDKVDLIVVNCVAGVSRSKGVAAALGKILNGDDSDAFKHGIPNMRVYRMLLNEYFGPTFKDFRTKKIVDNDKINFT